jgi:DNA-directed RNA polymerase subunit beta'
MSDKITTAGAIALKHDMPTKAARENFDIYTPLDKKGVGNMVKMLLKHGGPEGHEHINKLAKQFFNKATEIGASTPLSDYINDSDERQALIDEFDSHAQLILRDDKKTKQEKQQALGELVGHYDTRLEKQNIGYLLTKGSVAAKMAQTGARGNPKQLAVGTSSPLLSSNLKGEIVPVVIKSSFAEGMTPAEYMAMSYMGRGNTVLTQLSTSLPGALFKKLSPTVFHEVVTVDDCKTKNGILIPTYDTNSILGRYEAATNQLITEEKLANWRHQDVKQVKVRSILTCEAKQGTCKHCFGLMGDGKLPEIGENVGVIAAQSVSEVLTQSMLSTKHKATVGERKGNAYEQAANLMYNPAENFKDEATISEVNGKVQDISKTPLGDYNVTIGHKSHFVPQVQSLKVNTGDTVRIGDQISTGVVNPRKLVALRGLGAGRKYVANELRDIYGGGLDPRHFEVISKNLMKYVEVQDPGHTHFMPGEKVDVNTISKYFKKDAKDVPIDEAHGYVLAKPVNELTPGTFLDENHIQDLKDSGITHLPVSGNGLKVSPIVPGLQTAKLLDPNWVSKLSFTRLKDTLKEAASTGAESALHSVDPITPYIIGNEFGEGESGEY